MMFCSKSYSVLSASMPSISILVLSLMFGQFCLILGNKVTHVAIKIVSQMNNRNLQFCVQTLADHCSWMCASTAWASWSGTASITHQYSSKWHRSLRVAWTGTTYQGSHSSTSSSHQGKVKNGVEEVVQECTSVGDVLPFTCLRSVDQWTEEGDVKR